MDVVLSYIMLTITVSILGLIAFFLGILVGMPENDPEREIKYFRERIATLEGREHIISLKIYEEIMFNNNMGKDSNKDVKEKKGKDKKVIQTTWDVGKTEDLPKTS